MFEVLALALALSMDAFAVSIGLGTKKVENKKILALKAAIFFGIFQAIMPYLGYIGGRTLEKYIGGFDYIIASSLLFIIGGKMFYEACCKHNKEDEISSISNKVLITLAIATSLDAMGAGFTLHLFNLDIYLSLVIIGITTFIFSAIGVYIGHKGGTKYESKAEIFGGLILIAIGFKFFLEFI